MAAAEAGYLGPHMLRLNGNSLYQGTEGSCLPVSTQGEQEVNSVQMKSHILLGKGTFVIASSSSLTDTKSDMDSVLQRVARGGTQGQGVHERLCLSSGLCWIKGADLSVLTGYILSGGSFQELLGRR